MRTLVILGLLLISHAGQAADFQCQDFLERRHPKPYFSLLFEAAGGEFLSESKLAEKRPQAEIGDFPELIPFEDVGINEIALRIRMIMMNGAFRDYRQSGRWSEFEDRFLNSETSFDMGTLIWAAFTISAINGDLSLASKWIRAHTQQGWQDYGPLAKDAEQALVEYGLKERMLVYQAAEEVYEATTEWEQAHPVPEVEEKLLDWSQLTEALSSEELFLIQQALSWAPASSTKIPGLTPANLQSAIDLLISELTVAVMKEESIHNLEKLLAAAEVTEEEELLYGVNLSRWPAALNWLRAHSESGIRLVQDVAEFRKFYPEIR